MDTLILLGENTTGSSPISDGIDTVTSGLTQSFSDISSKGLASMSSVLPYALAIAGAVIVVMLAFKLFKRFSK